MQTNESPTFASAVVVAAAADDDDEDEDNDGLSPPRDDSGTDTDIELAVDGRSPSNFFTRESTFV